MCYFATLKRAALAALALTLAACASMNESQCASADWYDRGVRDGSDGRHQDRYQAYNKDCAEFGVQVDSKAWLSGWEIGIDQYCTRDNGYQVGLRGGSYARSCPQASQDTFLAAFQLGEALYNAQLQVDNLRLQIEELGDEAARDRTSDEQRRVLRRDRRHLKDDLRREEWNLDAAKDRARSAGFPVAY